MQPKALAGAVHAYAQNIDRLDRPRPGDRAHRQKHVALNILPEHYPYVGEALLGALRDVLGQAATEEVMEAWTEAYGFLADVLIERERQLYGRRAGPRAGGPVGGSSWWTAPSPRATSSSPSTCDPTDDGPIMPFKPGQYLTLQLDTDVGARSSQLQRLVRPRPRPAGSASSARPRPRRRPTRRQASVRVTSTRGSTGERPCAPPRPRATSSFPTRPTAARPLQRRRGPHADGQHAQAMADRGIERPVWFVHAALSGRHHAMKDACARSPTPSQRPLDRLLRVPRRRRRGGRRLRLRRADHHGLGQAHAARVRGRLLLLRSQGLHAAAQPRPARPRRADERIHFEFFGPRRTCSTPGPRG